MGGVFQRRLIFSLKQHVVVSRPELAQCSPTCRYFRATCWSGNRVPITIPSGILTCFTAVGYDDKWWFEPGLEIGTLEHFVVGEVRDRQSLDLF
jgi:hypothetical protein